MDLSPTFVSSLLGPPFACCLIPGGNVFIEDARPQGGSPGGECTVPDFWLAKYPITNAQYQAFLDALDGFSNPAWWGFSPQALRWRSDHPRPVPTAFPGPHVPRTRVSWYDSLAFCAWLTSKLRALRPAAPTGMVRLPTEAEWQRAALGDASWAYPWGDDLSPQVANFASRLSGPSPVGQFPAGASPYGALDMIGNVWEWCLSAWGEETEDMPSSTSRSIPGSLEGYTYRAMRGGAWNVSNSDHLRAAGRNGNSPRGQLNDAGFRLVYVPDLHPVETE